MLSALCLGAGLATGAPDPERHPVLEPQGKPVNDSGGARASEGPGLHLRAAVEDARFDRDALPEKSKLAPSLEMSAWRGERVNGSAVLWTEGRDCSQLRLEELTLKGAGGTLRASVSFLRYTSAEGALYAEIIDTGLERADLPAGTSRPAWVSVQVPGKAKAGTYKGTLRARAAGGVAVELPVVLEVKESRLPDPKAWGVHLDLWQHPEAVARWHDVEPWSPEHMALLRPLMARLADAGQKVISCSLIDEAWNGQTYDAWPSMVRWTKGRDGRMRYDYTHFDQYVELMMSLGVREQISCYTMLPWSLQVRYRDEATGDDGFLKLEPGKPSFEKIWGPFLKDFCKHLKAKGWMDITCIAIDERADAAVRASLDVIRRNAPGLKVASAVNHPSKLSADLYDMSPILTHATFAPGELEARQKAGSKTTFYVCMSPTTPNTYTISPLAEAEWLGLFAAANKLDGFLRWAYNSWGRNPFERTDFGKWPAGDCWLVYPGNRSSVHFERLRDGIEDFEKIALLRRAAAKSDARPALRKAVQTMNQELAELFTVKRSGGDTHAADVRRARELIDAAASQMR